MKLVICVDSGGVRWTAGIMSACLPVKGQTYEVRDEWQCGPDALIDVGLRPYNSLPCRVCGHRGGWPKRWFRYLNDPDFKGEENEHERKTPRPTEATPA